MSFLGPYTDAVTALRETRRSIAEVIGADPDTWPSHGNAPLAITACVELLRRENERRLSALKRLVACEGGAWHPERYARDREEALEAARQIIAEAEPAAIPLHAGEEG